jgi:hypothetical protein
MTRAFRLIPWIILLISLIVPAFFYNSIADEVMIMQSFFGNEEISAAKLLFTMFV